MTVTDTDASQPLRVRLMSVPESCVFAPVVDRLGSATSEVTWRVSPAAPSGLQRLEFEATDGVATVRSVVTVDVAYVARGPFPATDGLSRTVVGEVTGDGLVDVVATARFANVGGVSNTGEVYVWAGGTSSGGGPTARLRVPGAALEDRLGEASGQAVQLADVTGDGLLDVVVATSVADVGGVADTGAVYVWRGGSTLTGTIDPFATLRVPGASASARLGRATGQGVLLADLTNDGVIDVAAVSVARGSVYVWRGGGALTGPTDPIATLQVSGSGLGDATGQAVLVADVTGDGVPDVVAASATAASGLNGNEGVIHVWRGDAALTGSPSPLATLAVPGAAFDDQLTRVTGGNPGPGLLLSDVSGDGLLDVVAVASLADIGGVVDAGAVYVWRGGATLAGAVAPTATLRVPGAVSSDQLGNASGFGVQFADVTGDDTLDLVVGAALANVGGTVDAGAVYVWSGGAGLIGTMGPTASLERIGAVAGDQLGFVVGSSAVQLADVSGDGVDDVVVGASSADVAGVVDAGGVYLWTGGPLLVGVVQPSASLQVPGAAAADRLGAASGLGVVLAEVTGDGALDVVVAASGADEGGVTDAGGLYVWSGGAALAGTPAPTARLRVPGALPGDGLGSVLSEQGLQVADLTGDGQADIVAAAQDADVGGVVDAGAIYLWKGGSTLVGVAGPEAVLRVSGASAQDQLGRAASWRQLADVTGDGQIDVIAFTRVSDTGGVTDTGGAYVWRGGSSLTGTADPFMSLRVAGAQAQDFLGSAPVPLLDYTGDGVLDVLTGSFVARVGGVSNAGAVYVWPGSAVHGTIDALVLFNPGAVAFDELGEP